MTENLIGTFDTVEMLSALNATPRPRTFIRDRLFGGREKTFETQYVQCDFMKGKRSMAPFVSRKIGGKLVEKVAFTSKLYQPPMIGPRGVMQGDEMLGRAFGEVIGGAASPDERAANERARNLDIHDMLITRREEWMCAKMLDTGIITIVGEGVSDEIDLGFTNTDALAGNDVWGGTTSDPVNDIRNWKMTNIQLSGVTPDTLILGEDAAAAFLSDDQVKALLDVRNMMVGQVNVQDLPNGAEYIGTIVGVDIFAYPEWYIDDDTGVETPMIAASHAILFASAARSPESAIFYGAYYDVAKQQTLVGSRIPRSWVDVGANMEFYEVLSFPVPYVPDSDSWLVATVV